MSTVSRLAKLRAMPVREIAARVGYSAFVALERLRYRRGAYARADRLEDAIRVPRNADWRTVLASRDPAGRFFAGLDHPGRLAHLFRDRYQDEHLRARAMAAEVASGKLAFFGRQFAFGDAIDWHADPVTGTTWPRCFHADVPVHGGNVGFGDAKDVWELNRHQFFVDLAKVALVDGSRPHADALHRLLRHWMDEVPYGTGAAWACALEPAFRVWSWLWAYHMVLAAGLVDRETHLLWLTGFADHGTFLHRHLETYSSPYNHLIGEASALFALGLLFPEFKEAPAWRDRGRGVLESTIGQQFHDDGGTVEQSTFYHHATLGFYLLAAVLGRRHGIELSPAVWTAIERGIEFSATLMQPDGKLPRIGGADDGKPIRLEHLPFWDFRPYQAIGAVLFSRADFRFVAGRFWEDALWLLGPDAAAAFDRLPSSPPPLTRALRSSGYYVMRSDWSAAADYLCMDCGEQAGGLRRDDVPSAAHGHADCLSVVVALGGREVLVDPGFFCYNGEPAWEVQFRKTPAHNTVHIDGRDQARHLSKMAWSGTYQPLLEGWSESQSVGWVIGSHDGYARSAQPVRHRRTAWLRTGGYVVLCDELAGTVGHRGEAVFQFAPGELTRTESSVLFDERYELVWVASTPVQARVACGGPAPTDGWIASSLGVRHAAPRLALGLAIAQPRVVLLTVLVDRQRQASAAVRRGDVLSVDVVGDGWSDEIVAAFGTASASTSEVDTDAPLMIARRIGGHITETLQAGGTFARPAKQQATLAAATLPAASVCGS